MEKTRECLEFMETEEFKAIDILRNIRDDSSVRFLDETLDEAIKQLKTLIEDYRVVKKQNDYYSFEGRSCESCKYNNRCEIQDTITYINHYEETANDKPPSCSHWEPKDE